MRPFDYIAVLLSIVISFALAHLLAGIANMIENGVRRFSIPLAQWIAFSLFLCVDYWFFVWHLHDQQVWSLSYVIVLLTDASLIFLAARLIVPAASGGAPIDLNEFFEHKRRKYFAVVALLAALNEAINLTLPGFGSWLLGLMVAAWIVLFSIAAFVKSNAVQIGVAGANIALTVYYALTFVPAL